MIFDEETKKIVFSEKYASQNKEIKKALYSFDSNKYIIKNSTGLGVTHAMCNYTRGNLIILSPNNSMILEKAKGKYDCKKFFSICGENQSYKFDQLLNYLKQTPLYFQNVVVNLNAEQLINARQNTDLWELLTGFHTFIDECHAYTADSYYRTPQGAALELIYHEFKGKKVLSTATPIPFGFDIPKELGFEPYFIQRIGDKVKKLGYSEDRNHARSFIIDQIEKGIPVCVFTNNKDIHVSNPTRDVALNYVNLVGVNLNIKIQPYNRGNPNLKDPNLFKGADVIFLSSAYFAGYDIPIDCSILILSEQRSHHTKIHINNAVQAYGRCRKTVQEALYINVPSVYDCDGKKIHIPTSKDEVDKEIERYYYKIQETQNQIDKFGVQGTKYVTPAGYVNRGEIGANTLNIINDYFQYNEPQRLELFKLYNFELYPYESGECIQPKGKPAPFQEQIRNLYRMDKDLYWDYIKTKKELKYKDAGTFHYKLCLLNLSIYLIKEYNISPCIEMLNNDSIEPLRFYGTLNKWIRVNCPIHYLTQQLTPKQVEQIKHYQAIIPNMDEDLVRDWHMLYSMYSVSVGKYNHEIKKHLRLREIAGNKDNILKANKNWNNRTNLAKRAAITQGKKEYGPLTPKDLKTIAKVVKSSFKRLDESKKGKYTNMEKIIINHKKVINLHIQLMHMGRGNYANVRTENREYGAITGVGRVLRCLLPLKFLDLDMVSANPQAIDRLYGSNIAFDIYNNVMKNKGVDRDDAKEFYNSLLNNHRTKRPRARSIYRDICGYTPEQAKNLSELTADVDSGSFFAKMTEVEDNVMSSLANYLEVPSVRLHDGLIIPSWLCEDYALPVLFNNFRFHVSYFNTKDEYPGKTIELYERQFMWSDLNTEPQPVDERPTLKELLGKIKPIDDMGVTPLQRILHNYNKTG
ncbi:MAG: hypothetical protein ACQEWD_05820 [Bacteroidota bacterium]